MIDRPRSPHQVAKIGMTSIDGGQGFVNDWSVWRLREAGKEPGSATTSSKSGIVSTD